MKQAQHLGLYGKYQIITVLAIKPKLLAVLQITTDSFVPSEPPK